jgi:ribosomal protein L37AE/L43A
MRYKKEKILKFLEQLNVNTGCNVRCDCPNCGGRNTLSVVNRNGFLIWYCFKAGCNIKGNTKKEMQLSEAQAIVKKGNDIIKPVTLESFEGWCELEYSKEAIDYLNKNNCIDAYKMEPKRFFYDKLQDRVVFVQYDGPNTIKLASGRSLKGQQPKWFKYVALPGVYFEAPVFLGGTDTVFIVEDCASACSLSRLDYTIALCGTNYNLYALSKLIASAHMKVVICLDKDAQLTALKLQRDLKSVCEVPVFVKQLSDDAKYLDIDTLKKELHYGN